MANASLSSNRAVTSFFSSIIILSVFALGANGLDNGVGRRPAMGYNTWNDLQCKPSGSAIRRAADTLDKLGLASLGYRYVNIDDCWSASRDPVTNRLVHDPKAFPEGIKGLADFMHSRGFKLGIYTDRGQLTCAGRPGSKGREELDAQTFADWGIDYLKEDSCNATTSHATALDEYRKMRDALNKTGRPIYFSLCGWHTWYASPGSSIGNSWRIAGDVTNWKTMYRAIRKSELVIKYAGPGGWNDPDMLIGSGGGSIFNLLAHQSRTQFSMWAVLAAPLLIGAAINNLTAWDLATYSNVDVINVDQDVWGIQGSPVFSTCPPPEHLADLDDYSPESMDKYALTDCVQVWARPLSTGSYAVILLNLAADSRTVACDLACMAKIKALRPEMRGTNGTERIAFNAKNLWSKKVYKKIYQLESKLQASGGSELFLLTPFDFDEEAEGETRYCSYDDSATAMTHCDGFSLSFFFDKCDSVRLSKTQFIMLSALHGAMLLLSVGGVLWAVSYLASRRRRMAGRGLNKDLPVYIRHE